jgi:hypothetical protein
VADAVTLLRHFCDTSATSASPSTSITPSPLRPIPRMHPLCNRMQMYTYIHPLTDCSFPTPLFFCVTASASVGVRLSITFRHCSCLAPVPQVSACVFEVNASDRSTK